MLFIMFLLSVAYCAAHNISTQDLFAAARSKHYPGT